MNTPEDDQPQIDATRQKEAKGGVGKWVAIGCGSLILLVVALFALGGYLFYRSFSVDPARAESVAQDIIGHEKPAGFKGEFSMSMMVIKMAALTSGPGPEEPSHIMFLAMPGGRVSQEDLRRQMREKMKGRGDDRRVVEDRGHETFKVRGKDVDAQVQLTAGKGGNRLLQYTVAVEGRGGDPVLLLLMGSEKQMDHDWVQKFLDTVK